MNQVLIFVVVFFSQMGFLNRLFFFFCFCFWWQCAEKGNNFKCANFLWISFACVFFDSGEKILLSHQFLLFLFIFMFFLKVYALLMYLFYDFDVKWLIHNNILY